MKYFKWALIIFLIASVGYLVAKEYAGSFNKEVSKPLETQVAEHPNGIVIYYFHGNRRCPTCMAIEKYSHEAVMPDIESNRLTWEMINIEQPENKTYFLCSDFLPIYEIAAMFVASGHGLIEVRIPSQNAVANIKIYSFIE